VRRRRLLQQIYQPLREEICLEDRYSASYKIKVPHKNQDADDEEQFETEVAERKCSLYHHRPETLQVLVSHIESTLNLISRDLKAERRNNNETSGLKTSPRGAAWEKMTYTRDLCGIQIKFDSSVKSPIGLAILLEKDGSLHNCPYKEPAVENWDPPSRQYAKRQPRQPQRQQQQLASFLYNEQHQHRDIYEKIYSLKTEIAFLPYAFRELAKSLTPATGEPKK
jgi:hypothetical protein